ncbi:hypothetical protein X740_13990 [Mesorhizobium sp. LNHC221B00]|uniref:hypothetical protein n=1 Tax=Mesorhizobium sp. LNHC221B00 TaxID=1287233 RepID=UPI0003CE3376|nr:hypothetical protein [Mesorhizobium sp. LNHC221B00]ESY80133.1 hypothetical protein X740_13990 [Mesorhizobium sp. LNHC221B00]
MDINLFFKEMYSFEIERKDKLDGSVGVMLTAVTGIVVSMVFVISDIGSKNPYPDKRMILSLFAVCSFVLGGSILFLLVGFYGRTYKYVDYPSEMMKYYNKLESHYRGDGQAADKEFADAVTHQFVSFGTHNAQANDEKSENYFQAKRWFAWSLLPFACGIITYGHYLIFD